MQLTPVDVLSTRDTREQLPTLLKGFREKRLDSDPVIVGANRKPEAVLLSYDVFRIMLERLDDLAILDEIAARAGESERLTEDQFLAAVKSKQQQVPKS